MYDSYITLPCWRRKNGPLAAKTQAELVIMLDRFVSSLFFTYIKLIRDIWLVQLPMCYFRLFRKFPFYWHLWATNDLWDPMIFKHNRSILMNLTNTPTKMEKCNCWSFYCTSACLPPRQVKCSRLWHLLFRLNSIKLQNTWYTYFAKINVSKRKMANGMWTPDPHTAMCVLILQS